MGSVLNRSSIQYQKSKIICVWILLLTTLFVSQSTGFDCKVTTSFDKSFPDKWTHAPAGAPPFLSNRDTVHAGIPWRIHVFFTNISRDDSGRADLSFSYKVLRSDSSTFFDTAGISAISGPVGKGGITFLSYRIPIVTFPLSEKPGKYRLIVSAEDRIDGTKKVVEKTMVLSGALKTKATNFTAVTFNVWVHSYCIDPDPGRAIAAFSFFIGDKMSDDNEIFWPVFYFFQCLFSDNPALVKKLAAVFPKSSLRLQEYTVFLFRSIHVDKKVLGGSVPDTLWKKFDKAAEAGLKDPFTDAFTIRSNRLMEFGFYYYGAYSIVRFLVDCLGVQTAEGYDWFVKRCGSYADNCSENFNKETAGLFYSDARGILKKAYSKHPLISAYCNYIMENEKLSTDAKLGLGEIIDLLKK
jgi:hypothetical protein